MNYGPSKFFCDIENEIEAVFHVYICFNYISIVQGNSRELYGSE